MDQRFYHYRGFEVSLWPRLAMDPKQSFLPASPMRYCCLVTIRAVDTSLLLESFIVEHAGHAALKTEFDAVLYGCYAAERRVNDHRAAVAAERVAADVV